MNKECVVCRVVKEQDEIIIYEDENVIACLSPKQVTQGKTSVYYKKHVTKFTDLSKEERDALMESVFKVGALLEKSLKPDHMNYCLLGNYYKHLHWHIYPRYEDKDKDNFYFKTGLEPVRAGREVNGRYDVSKQELEALAKIILKQP